MLGKLKEALAVRDELQSLRAAVAEQKTSIAEISHAVSGLAQTIAPIHEDAIRFHTALTEDMRVLKETKETFSKELFDFSLLKGQLHKKLLEKFQQELATEIAMHAQFLSDRRQHLQGLEQELDRSIKLLEPLTKLPEQLQAISQEIHRLTQASGRYTQEIERISRQKMQLQDTVEQLERLCAGLRRAPAKP